VPTLDKKDLVNVFDYETAAREKLPWERRQLGWDDRLSGVWL
jgi:hypothetical protein